MIISLDSTKFAQQFALQAVESHLTGVQMAEMLGTIVELCPAPVRDALVDRVAAHAGVLGADLARLQQPVGPFKMRI